MATFTKTVVFTDLANYTQSTAKADREQLRKLIHDHEVHTQKIFDPHGGQIVKGLGDSFMAIFDSATAATKACMEIVETTMKIGDKEMKIRASLATGDVEEISGDYFGEAVNLSARINSKVPAGECWFANRTRLCMNQKEIPWEPAGTFDFKGIPEPVNCFRAVAPGQCFLPEEVEEKAKNKNIKFISPTEPPVNKYPSDVVVVIRGFDIGTDEFSEMVARIPVTIRPSQVYLLATNLPSMERQNWLDKGFGFIIGSEEAFDTNLEAIQSAVPESAGSQTLFMDFGGGPDMALEMVGFAVRNLIPVIQAYSYCLLTDGSWGFGSGGIIVKVTINTNGVFMQVYSTNVSINGRKLQPGMTEPLIVESLIQTPAGQFRYIPVNSPDYKGIIVGKTTQSIDGMSGDTIELGREPGFPGFELPDRAGVDSVTWAAGPRAQKARQAGYTLDRALIGRKQAKLEIKNGSSFVLHPVHERIPTYAYYKDALHKLDQPCGLGIGDYIVIGTYVLGINPPMS